MDNYLGEQPVPPNAPRRRALAQEPLEVLDRLVADHASALLDDESAEHFAQVADEIAVTRGSLTLAGRLQAAVGGDVRIDVEMSASAQSWSVSGQLVEVGEKWCHVREGTRNVVINLELVASVAIPESALPESMAPGARTATWASLMRRFESVGTVVTVHLRSSLTRVGRVVLAGQDHFDLSLAQPDSGLVPLDTVTIALHSIAIIEWR